MLVVCYCFILYSIGASYPDYLPYLLAFFIRSDPFFLLLSDFYLVFVTPTAL